MMMAVKPHSEIYKWVQRLDSAGRVDFICSLLEQYCTPWELRLFGSCLEHLARSHYSEFIDSEKRANNLNELKLLNNIDLLHLVHGEYTRSRLITYMCLLRSKPHDVRCTQVLYEILVNMGNHLQSFILDPMQSYDKLVEDVRLLLTIAIHHPAFSYEQHRHLKTHLDFFVRTFDHASDEEHSSRKSCNAQCQTEDHFIQQGEDNSKPVIDSSQNGTSALLLSATRSPVPSATKSCHPRREIESVKLLDSHKIKSNNILYRIEVKSKGSEPVIVLKSYNDIRMFHDKLVKEFPEDVGSPKHFRHIPLLRGKAGDVNDQTIKVYLMELSKMPLKYLNSTPVHNFFLVTSQSATPSAAQSISNSSVSISLSDTTVDSAVLLDKPICSQKPNVNLNQQYPINIDNLGLPTHTVIVTNSSQHSPTPVPPPGVTPRITPVAKVPHSPTATPTPTAVPVKSAANVKEMVQPRDVGQPDYDPAIISSATATSHTADNNKMLVTPVTVRDNIAPKRSATSMQAISGSEHLNPPSVGLRLSQSATVLPHHSVNQPSTFPRRPLSRFSFDFTANNLDSLTPHTILKLLRLHKYEHLFRNVTVREMMSMSQEEFKVKGMADGAAKKLAEQLGNLALSDSSTVYGEHERLNNDNASSLRCCDSSSSDVTSPRASPHSGASSLPAKNESLKLQSLPPNQMSMESSKRQDAPSVDIRKSQSTHDLRTGSPVVQTQHYGVPNYHMMSVGQWQSAGVYIDGTASLVPLSTHPPPCHSRSETGITVIPINPHIPPMHSDSFITHSEPVKVSNSNKTNGRPVTKQPHRFSREFETKPPAPYRQKSEPGLAGATGMAKQPTVEEIQRKQLMKKQAMLKKTKEPEGREEQQTTQTVGSPRQNSQLAHLTPIDTTSKPRGVNDTRVNLQSPTAQPLKPKPQSTVPRDQNQVLPKIPQPIVPTSINSQSHAHYVSAPLSSPSNYSNQSVSPGTQSMHSELSAHHSPAASGAEESDGFSVDLGEGREVGQSRDKVVSAAPSTQMTESLGNAVTEPVVEKDVNRESSQLNSGGATVVIQQAPYLPTSIDGSDIPYYINGYANAKQYAYITPQEMERLSFIQDGNYNTQCYCQACVASNFYIPMTAVSQPGRGGGGPLGRAPSVPPQPSPQIPPQHHNGFIYPGFSGTYVSTSNGLISPGVPNFTRSNSSGPPNGLMQRSDVMYPQQMPMMAAGSNRPNYHAAPTPAGVVMPPTQYQMAQGYYYSPSPFAYNTKRRIHCTNCGQSNHTYADCPEPFDNPTSGHDFHLDMTPQHDSDM